MTIKIKELFYKLFCDPFKNVHQTITSSFTYLIYIGLSFLVIFIIGLRTHNDDLRRVYLLTNKSSGLQKVGCNNNICETIVLLYITAICIADLFARMRIPPLLGPLVAGIFLKVFTTYTLEHSFTNMKQIEKEFFAFQPEPSINKAAEFACLTVMDYETTSYVRKLALSIILTQAGLHIDFRKVKENLRLTFFLSFVPCGIEGLATGLFCYLINGWPFSIGTLFGYTCAGVSPAILVPSLLYLDQQGYGKNKGISSTLITASSFDDIAAIIGFTISMNAVEASDGISVATIYRLIALIPIGLSLGAAFGLIFWIIPPKSMSHAKHMRQVLLILCLIMFTMCLEKLEFEESGPIACITCSMVIQAGWLLGFPARLYIYNREMHDECTDQTNLNNWNKPKLDFRYWYKKFPVSYALNDLPLKKTNSHETHINSANIIHQAKLDGFNAIRDIQEFVGRAWRLIEPLTFILIGFQVDLMALFNGNGNTSAVALSLFLGILCRYVSVVLVTTGSGFTFREKLFVGVAWLPKATVPAALASTTYDFLTKISTDKDQLERANLIVTLAVVSIVITAPFGAITIPCMGQRVLRKENIIIEV